MFARFTKFALAMVIGLTSAAAMAQKGPPPGRGPGGGGGGGHEEAYGNNLSFPVIWSDGAATALPLRSGLQFEGNYSVFPEDPFIYWYHQQDPLNVWQAGNMAGGPGFLVDEIDWGDNLEARDWPVKTKLLRVETVLYKFLADGTDYPPMTGFTMKRVSEETGTNEMQGAGVDLLAGEPLTYAGDEATVYTPYVRLIIQKLPASGDLSGLVWTSMGWSDESGILLPVMVDKPAYVSVDGPGGYGAEVNVSGKVVYGYNWNISRMPEVSVGRYRITFSIEPVLSTTDFDDATRIRVPDEEVRAEEEPSGGGVAVVDPDNNLTYIDITLTGRAGGGGRGGPRR